MLSFSVFTIMSFILSYLVLFCFLSSFISLPSPRHYLVCGNTSRLDMMHTLLSRSSQHRFVSSFCWWWTYVCCRLTFCFDARTTNIMNHTDHVLFCRISLHSPSLLMTTTSGRSADILQKVYLPVINNAVCTSWYQSQGKHVIISSKQFCAGFKEGGKDACQVNDNDVNNVSTYYGKNLLALSNPCITFSNLIRETQEDQCF